MDRVFICQTYADQITSYNKKSFSVSIVLPLILWELEWFFSRFLHFESGLFYLRLIFFWLYSLFILFRFFPLPLSPYSTIDLGWTQCTHAHPSHDHKSITKQASPSSTEEGAGTAQKFRSRRTTTSRVHGSMGAIRELLHTYPTIHELNILCLIHLCPGFIL